MASNSFGNLFRMTTWGESHGPAIGVVVDGMPSGVRVDLDEIQAALDRRRPGRTEGVSPRQEPDRVQILSGIFEGESTGHPIALLIENQDADPTPYRANLGVLKPGHAEFTYRAKYGVFDHFGGGRASARETACRVAAGALAQAFLQTAGIACLAFLEQVGTHRLPEGLAIDEACIAASELFCPDPITSDAIATMLHALQKTGDSIGGVVAFRLKGVPCGLGDPVYEKLEARLAHAMMSLPATKGFEIGEGFSVATMRGSEHNDGFTTVDGVVRPATNRAGGTLGGIATGEPVTGRVVFKPTSSIRRPQASVKVSGESTSFELADGARHDPCVAIRAVPVVQAMCRLVLADALLMNRMVRV